MGSISANPTVADIDITTGATNWLWVVFAIMLSSCIGIGGLSFTQNPGRRAFHYISMAILATASVAYFCLASDLGATPVQVEFLRGYPAMTATRSIWYVRYIDWVITTPLLLLELLLVSGLPLSAVFACVFADEVMIVTGLVGALVASSYKWGLFAFGCAAMFVVFYILYVPGLLSAKHMGGDYYKSYFQGALVLSILWTLYPVCWGLAEGGNVISPNGELIFYSILDIFAKPVFAMVHLFGLRKIDYERLQLSSGKYSEFAALPTSLEKGSASDSHLRAGTLKEAEANAAAQHGNAQPAPAVRPSADGTVA